MSPDARISLIAITALAASMGYGFDLVGSSGRTSQ